MLSYTGQRNLFSQLVNDVSSSTLTLGDTLMNEYAAAVLAMRPWWFVMRFNNDLVTTQGTQFYQVPFNYRKLDTVTVTSGTVNYIIQKCPDRAYWDQLNFSSSPQSNWPQWYYIIDGQVGFWPIPSTSDLPINFTYEAAFPSLSVADYTTGSIVSVSNGGTAVVGTGTSWTTPMTGRFLRITPSDSATTNGDGLWYEIASVGGSTSLTLVREYGGLTLAAATASYAIGQMSAIPEAYQMLPVYHACFVYFSSVNPQIDRAQMFEKMRDGLMAQMITDHSKSGSQSNINIGSRYNQNVNNFITRP